MENVKFVKFDKREGTIKYFFKINDRLADFVRKNTCYKPDVLPLYLTEGNLFVYNIAPGWNFAKMHDLFVETVEKLSNSGDDSFFYNHLITNDGYHRAPSEIHELMHKEYGLADIDEEMTESADSMESDLEWWTAHFFISFGNMIYGSPIDEEQEVQQHVTVGAGFVSEFLQALKNMDIVIVDDARKVGDEEMKEIRKKMAKEKEHGSEETQVLDMRTHDDSDE